MAKAKIEASKDVESSGVNTVANNEDPKSNPQGNAVKPPDQWVTKDEPMTGAQASYAKTLSEEAGQEFDPNLTKGEASKLIEELQEETGRGQDK